MAQGEHRLARAQVYTSYLKDHYNVQLTFTTIPACGHNARCMFTAERALPYTVILDKTGQAESDTSDHH